MAGDFRTYPVRLDGLDSAAWRALAETLAAYAQRVVELTPEGYTVSITQEAGTFLVTNTPKQPPETPPVTPPVNPPGQKTLPQTGALWWPVPILAAAGLLLIAAGAGKKRKT